MPGYHHCGRPFALAKHTNTPPPHHHTSTAAKVHTESSRQRKSQSGRSGNVTIHQWRKKTLVECMTHNQSSSCCCYSDTFALGIHNTTTAAADARTLSHSLLLLFLLLRSTTWKQVQHRQKHTAEVALPLRRGEKKSAAPLLSRQLWLSRQMAIRVRLKEEGEYIVQQRRRLNGRPPPPPPKHKFQTAINSHSNGGSRHNRLSNIRWRTK